MTVSLNAVPAVCSAGVGMLKLAAAAALTVKEPEMPSIVPSFALRVGALRVVELERGRAHAGGEGDGRRVFGRCGVRSVCRAAPRERLCARVARGGVAVFVDRGQRHVEGGARFLF